MKNLKLCWEVTSNLELQSPEEVVRFAALDIEQNRLFFASSANFVYTIPLPSLNNGAEWGKTLLPTVIEPIDLDAEDFITSLEYVMEKEALVVGTSNGSMLLYNVDENVTEIVGRVDGGVKCISPSPDGDLLGIITGFGQMVVMTPDWDLLYETGLDDDAEDVDKIKDRW